MRTPTRLWLLSYVTSLVVGLLGAPAFAQAQSPDIMRIDPAVQRERDTTRIGILQDELAKETRELDTAQAELSNAEASRASAGKVQEIMARVTLHRRNLSALEREIALTGRAADSVIRVTAKRQPDNWLIPGSRHSAGEPNKLMRRRLPLADTSASLPPWIIQSGFTGIQP